jgi:hypothetical protein
MSYSQFNNSTVRLITTQTYWFTVVILFQSSLIVYFFKIKIRVLMVKKLHNSVAQEFIHHYKLIIRYLDIKSTR